MFIVYITRSPWVLNRVNGHLNLFVWQEYYKYIYKQVFVNNIDNTLVLKHTTMEESRECFPVCVTRLKAIHPKCEKLDFKTNACISVICP